jgi:transcription elongation factor GreA
MKTVITPYGYAKLRNELQKLRAMRPDLAKAIEIARAHGDISENADYDAAKDRSGMIEAKIRDIEAKLSSAEVVNPKAQLGSAGGGNKVVFGVEVLIEDIDSGEQRRVTIVGEEESDTARGYLSYTSPFGKALIGKEIGDIAKVQAPAGKREYEILEIILIDWELLAQDLANSASTNTSLSS